MQPDPADAQVETPLEDAAEHASPVTPDEIEESDEEIADAAVHRGLEVGEWDAVEQARTVNIDDEDR